VHGRVRRQRLLAATALCFLLLNYFCRVRMYVTTS
jgi:hypothetical protein